MPAVAYLHLYISYDLRRCNCLKIGSEWARKLLDVMIRIAIINPMIPEGVGVRGGGHHFINLGKLPNPWTDRDQTWHTYIQIHQGMEIG